MSSYFLISQMKYNSDYNIKLSSPKGRLGNAAIGMIVTLPGIITE